VHLVPAALNLKECDDPRTELAKYGFPVDALPPKLTGKYSYTLTGHGGSKVEVNVKQRHFRINAVAVGMDAQIGPPNLPWSKFETIEAAWEATTARAGFYCVPRE
jgi:hypothetical protein